MCSNQCAASYDDAEVFDSDVFATACHQKFPAMLQLLEDIVLCHCNAWTNALSSCTRPPTKGLCSSKTKAEKCSVPPVRKRRTHGLKGTDAYPIICPRKRGASVLLKCSRKCHKSDCSVDEGLPKASNLTSTRVLCCLPQKWSESYIALRAAVSA